MRIGMMVMIMAVAAVMIVMVVMHLAVMMMMRMVVPMRFVRVQRREGQAVLAAECLVAAGGIAIAAAGAVLQPAADALDMMVMAFLRRAKLGLEAEHLLAIFAHRTVHQILALNRLADAVDEGLDHHVVVVEIGRLDDLDVGEFLCRFIGGGIDALHQNAGEEEIGKDDDPLVAEPGCMLERGRDEREGDAGISRPRPSHSPCPPRACA